MWGVGYGAGKHISRTNIYMGSKGGWRAGGVDRIDGIGDL